MPEEPTAKLMVDGMRAGKIDYKVGMIHFLSPNDSPSY